jgi:hypothetical protein
VLDHANASMTRPLSCAHAGVHHAMRVMHVDCRASSRANAPTSSVARAQNPRSGDGCAGYPAGYVRLI